MLEIDIICYAKWQMPWQLFSTASVFKRSFSCYCFERLFMSIEKNLTSGLTAGGVKG